MLCSQVARYREGLSRLASFMEWSLCDSEAMMDVSSVSLLSNFNEHSDFIPNSRAQELVCMKGKPVDPFWPFG